MQHTLTPDTPENGARRTTVSGQVINLDDIEQILMSHEAVMEAEVNVLRKRDGKDCLSAVIRLKKGYPPSDDMKNDLAWHVVADLGKNIYFKNIEFADETGVQTKTAVPELREGQFVHITGHSVNTSDVRSAFLDLDEVVDADIDWVTDPKKGDLLVAKLTLKNGVAPSNDLKTHLAWEVQCSVSPHLRFKSINFGDGEDAKGEASGKKESMVIVDQVGDEGVSMRISSHRISTTEVTMTLLKHPDVADAAVVNIPDDGVGEKMKAFVKLKEGVVPSNDLKLELAWFVMSELKPIAVFKSVDLETPQSVPTAMPTRESALKERVLISGHTVLSADVEKVLANHDSVAEAIVIGVPDERHGEALKAFVTLKGGVLPSEDLQKELAWFARTEIGPDVVFKSIDFKKYLPKAYDKETLKSILWADAMHVPAKISITVAD